MQRPSAHPPRPSVAMQDPWQWWVRSAQTAERGVLPVWLLSGGSWDAMEAFVTRAARSVCCEQGPTCEPCGQCSGCRCMMHGTHPDWHVLGERATSPDVDALRGMARACSVRPMGANRVWWIPSPVETWHATKVNALLKVLEEPQPCDVFFLCTLSLQRVPQTLRSRAAVLRLPLAADPAPAKAWADALWHDWDTQGQARAVWAHSREAEPHWQLLVPVMRSLHWAYQGVYQPIDGAGSTRDPRAITDHVPYDDFLGWYDLWIKLLHRSEAQQGHQLVYTSGAFVATWYSWCTRLEQS